MRKLFRITILFFIITACDKESQDIVISSDDFHAANENLSRTMVHDIFSPPVASRVYAYANIAAFEVLAQFNPDYNSLAGQVTDFTPVPKADSENINTQMAALTAFYEVGKSLVFSEEKMTEKRDSLYNSWKARDEKVFLVSEAYGMKVAQHVKEWMMLDNYAETRSMPKFTVKTEDESRWQPTPPSYMDGIEPHWMKIRPFVIDSSSQFKPVPPPEFSMVEGSRFHTELMEVYNIREEIAQDEDNSEKLFLRDSQTALDRKISFFHAELANNSPRHDYLGYLICRHWGLSSVVEGVVRWHHEPDPEKRQKVNPESKL